MSYSRSCCGRLECHSIPNTSPLIRSLNITTRKISSIPKSYDILKVAVLQKRCIDYFVTIKGALLGIKEVKDESIYQIIILYMPLFPVLISLSVRDLWCMFGQHTV